MNILIFKLPAMKENRIYLPKIQVQNKDIPFILIFSSYSYPRYYQIYKQI